MKTPIFSCLDIDQTSDWLDVAAWSHLEAQLPAQLLEQLIRDESFEVALRLDLNDQTTPEQAAILQQMHQYGQRHTFDSAWLSYPLLRAQTSEGAWHRMPLLAWQVRMLPVADQPNIFLLQYNKGEWAINKEFAAIHPLANVVTNNLWELMTVWAKDLQVEELQPFSLEPCPAQATTDYKMGFVPSLLLLPQDKHSIATQEPLPAEPTAESTVPETTTPETTEQPPVAETKPIASVMLYRTAKTWKTAIPALPLSSEQNNAAHSLYQGKSVLVQGLDDTGKTHWLASVLPSIWADGGNALLVLPTGVSSSDLLYHLEQMGLKDVGVMTLLDDELLEKERLLTFLEKLPTWTKNADQHPASDISYKKQSHTYHRYRSELDGISAHLQTEVVSGKYWADMVGDFLTLHQQAGKHFLQRALRTLDLLYSESEFHAISEELKMHQPIFNQLQTLNHPLNLLHDAVFDQPYDAAETMLHALLEKQQARGWELLRLYSFLIDDYASSLQMGYDDYADMLRRQAESVLYTLSLYVDIYGDGLQRSGAMLKLMGIFSGRHRDVLAAKDALFTAYENMQEDFKKYNYFEYKLPNIRQTPLPEVAEKLKGFLVELERWQLRTPKWVEQKIQEWTTTLPIKIEYKRQLEDAERALQQWAVGLQEASAFQRKFELRETSVLRRLDFIKEILGFLSETRRLMVDFKPFYAWRSHWMGLSERTRQSAQALVEAQAENWEAAFGAWYLHKWLGRLAGLPRSERQLPLQEYVENFRQLRTAIAQHALVVRRFQQAQRVQQWKKEGINWRASYQAKGLMDLLQALGLEQLRDICPLMIVTPEWAQRLADLGNTPWDLVAIEAAHQLDALRAMSLVSAGAQVVAMGLPVGDLPSGGASFLTHAAKQSDYYRQHSFSMVYSKDAKTTQYPPQIAQESSFRDAVKQYLAGYLDPDRLETSVDCQGVLVDVLIKPIHKGAASIAVLCDGWCKKPTWTDYEWALYQRSTLEAAGHVVRYAWSDEWLRNPEKALQALVAFVVHWDRQYLPKQ